jgi:hypothetical protein
MPGRVVAVVLNYQHSGDTLLCVQSLGSSDYSNLQILVLDNGSDEAAVSQLRQELDPTVVLIESGENLGYGRGNNIGLAKVVDAGAEFAWVVNPDVVADPTALSLLVETSNQHPDAGIVGSRIVYGGVEPAKIWFDGGIIDWEASGSPSHLHMGHMEAVWPAGRAYDVDYVTGAGMLLRTKMVREIGLIPDEWFLYFEETEYNLRAQRAGWRTMVNPRSRLHHYKRSEGELPATYYVYYFVRNRYIFGMEIAGATSKEVRADLEHWVEAWRSKVERHDPGWVSIYDRLVTEATRDGIQGRRGYRDLAEIELAGAA